MMVSHRSFNVVAVAAALLELALLPFWPYSRWGYFPSGLLVAIVIFMFMLKGLARD